MKRVVDSEVLFEDTFETRSVRVVETSSVILLWFFKVVVFVALSLKMKKRITLFASFWSAGLCSGCSSSQPVVQRYLLV
jgi:hypothetical protein